MNVRLHSTKNETESAAAPRGVRAAASAPEFHRSEAASGLENSMTIERARYYRTAKALVSCAHFSKGEFVSVSEPWLGDNGKIWFTINRSERGPLSYSVCYPQDHLTEFCF